MSGPHKKLALLVVAALLALGSAPSSAHSFRVALLAPFSGPNADSGKEALAGFRVATGERDAHPGGESDGHLGGLDVYVLELDITPGIAAAMDKFNAHAMVEPVVFLVAAVPQALLAPIKEGLGDAPTILIAPPLSANPAPEGEEEPRTLSGESFATAFERDYGKAPRGPAFAGYRAARLIDRAVRAVDGDFSRRAQLEAALGAAGKL